MTLRNFGIIPQHYTASPSRRPRPESSQLWKPQISKLKVVYCCYLFCFLIYLTTLPLPHTLHWVEWEVTMNDKLKNLQGIVVILRNCPSTSLRK